MFSPLLLLSAVLAGLGPAIHDFGQNTQPCPAKSWVPGPSPGMTRGEIEGTEERIQR